MSGIYVSHNWEPSHLLCVQHDSRAENLSSGLHLCRAWWTMAEWMRVLFLRPLLFVHNRASCLLVSCPEKVCWLHVVWWPHGVRLQDDTGDLWCVDRQQSKHQLVTRCSPVTEGIALNHWASPVDIYDHTMLPFSLAFALFTLDLVQRWEFMCGQCGISWANT